MTTSEKRADGSPFTETATTVPEAGACADSGPLTLRHAAATNARRYRVNARCSVPDADLRLEILERLEQPVFEWNLRLPAQQRAGPGDVGPADLGIVLRQGTIDDPAPGAGDPDDHPGDLLDRHLVRVADV